MLQLPQSNKPPRFTRAQIAEMSRGAKSKVKAKPLKDPAVALVTRADAVLDAYYDAVNDAYGAAIKLSKEDQARQVAIYIPDELLNVEWSNGYAFTSLKHIDQQFCRATKRAKQRISDAEERLRKGRNIHEMFKSDLEAQITSARRAISLFRKHRGPLKDNLRAEQRRLHKVQSRVGLVSARRDVMRNFRSLQRITAEIAAVKPKTLEGALAVAAYVERRLWCDRPQLFADEGSLPGNLGRLMRAALEIIKREAARR